MCERLLSLESLEVSGCVSLQEIFDLQGIIFKEGNSIAAATQSRELSFSNLQNLTIFVCPSLKNLFAVANEGVSAQQVPARFCFSKLTSLKLDILPELRNFCPGRHIVKCPVLKTLDLSGCATDDECQMQQYLLLEENVHISTSDHGASSSHHVKYGREVLLLVTMCSVCALAFIHMMFAAFEVLQHSLSSTSMTRSMVVFS
ncbi:hypothetical protein JRO89_XS03G0316500 [Xanthoceras sorbifolium]|uniref:Uncharacterized protein n=1 Tax=Xanthoceras sorbifolium TaxID=99658 RepID=A0ABQ8ID42_9ROSI|nr:hypothetical protein JRO89_XS03G0316500 [Xanthoceras sorbifolium]